MTIQYVLQQDDLVAFWLYHYAHSPTMRRQHRLGVFIITATVVVAPLVLMGTHFGWQWWDPAFLGVPTVAGAITAMFYHWRLRSRYLRISRKLYNEGRNAGLGERVTMAIGAEGVEVESAVGMSRFRWSVVERVAVTDKHIFLYIGSVQAQIVPMEAFADASQRVEFLRQVETYRQPAVNAGWFAGPPAEPKCPQCGYGLYHAKEQRCPECGRRFEPGEVDLRLAEWDGATLRPRVTSSQ